MIGNGRYPEIPLNNPEHDARLVAQTLRSLDFEVGEHLNLQGPRLQARAAGIRSPDGRRRQVASVFYYAGHGMQIGGRNFLLPVDIALRDEAEVRDEAIDMQEALLDRMSTGCVRARASSSSTPAATTRSRRAVPLRATTNGLAEMAAPGALIAFSAAPGRVAEDGPVGGNSIYTRYLASEMRTAGWMSRR